MFGNIQFRKIKILARLNGIHLAQERQHYAFLDKLELELNKEFELICEQEYLTWSQRARCDWINFGDRNTSYFHARAVRRKRRKHIQALKGDNDEWCNDE